MFMRACLQSGAVLLTLMVGCSAGNGSTVGKPQGSDQGAGGQGGSGAGVGTGGVAQGGSGAGPWIPAAGTAGSPGDDDCPGVVDRAEKREGGKADIIFVLDNSGSMTEEAIAVQVNMNRFSQIISDSGIDAHVVVISSGPPSGQSGLCAPLDFACWASLGGSSNGVCVDPPLGTPGACPDGDDTNFATGYMHWREEVGSHNALAMVESTYHGWQGMLREDAAKTFVVVTDDENSPPPTGAEFTTWVNSQPLFQQALWRFSGVFCVTDGSNCANIGTTYTQLVAQTGGIQGDLAQFSTGQIDAQFAAVFDSLADAVIADAVPVQCEWLIPEPPVGQTLDPDMLNVKFTRGTGQTETLYGVGDDGTGVSACPPAADYLAWYYDNPTSPTRVIACPDTCPVLQSDDAAEIQVQFGCDRERPPIK
jgi:hypothetical protein